MIIEKALVTDSHQISELLSNYYSTLNKQIGSDYYNTDLDVMKKHVMERLMNNQSIYKYFVCRSSEGAIDFLGFANISVEKNRGGLLILLLTEAGASIDSQENITKKLVEYTLNFFKENSISMIKTELSDDEKDLLNIIESLGGKRISTNYLIKQ